MHKKPPYLQSLIVQPVQPLQPLVAQIMTEGQRPIFHCTAKTKLIKQICGCAASMQNQ